MVNPIEVASSIIDSFKDNIRPLPNSITEAEQIVRDRYPEMVHLMPIDQICIEMMKLVDIEKGVLG